MKLNNRYLLFLVLWCVSFAPFIHGQIRYGSIEYDITINLEKRLGSDSRVPGKYGGYRGQDRFSGDNKYLVEKATLYFNDSMTVFITNPPESMRDLNRTFITSTEINHTSNVLKTDVSLFGEDFIIRDSLPQHIWKFTNKERIIAGKMAKQAITQINDTTIIYAWFSTDFFPSIGPESYWNLPGAILGLAYEDGSVTYFATKINLEHPDLANKFPKNKKREVYTRKEFIDEFDDKYGSTHPYYQLIKDMLHFF